MRQRVRSIFVRSDDSQTDPLPSRTVCSAGEVATPQAPHFLDHLLTSEESTASCLRQAGVLLEQSEDLAVC